MSTVEHPANDNDGSDPGPAKHQPSRKCPLCGKPVQTATRPFCSKRCADIDLHRWLGGVYRVPDGPDLDEPDRIVGDEA